jgi:DNA-binding Lrp family transcriptional regulator
MSVEVDEKDLKILEVLKGNAKARTSTIARKTGIPPTTVHNRIKKMEKNKVIKSYAPVLDQKKMGKELLAYVLVKLAYRLPTGEKLSEAEVVEKIKKELRAEELSVVAGETDVIAKVRTKNIRELNDAVTGILRNVDGVDGTKTLVVLREVDYSNQTKVLNTLGREVTFK